MFPGKKSIQHGRIQDAILWEEASSWCGDRRHLEMGRPSGILGDAARDWAVSPFPALAPIAAVCGFDE